MKKSLCALVVALVALSSGARATEVLTGEAIVTLPASRTINDDCVALGSDIQGLGQVNGDLLAAGSTVSITGPVRGDVQAVGGTLTLRGPIAESLRAAGGSILVEGKVGQNALLAGGNVSLGASARVGRDAFLAGKVLKVDAPIGGDLRLTGEEATVAGEVQGNLRAEVKQLTLASSALIHGNLTVTSPKAPIISPGAKVLGQVRHRVPEPTPQPTASPTGGGIIGWLVGSTMRFVTLFVLGALALTLAPTGVGRLETALRSQTGTSLLIGSATLVLVPLVSILLMTTIVGIPAGIALLLLYVAVLLHTGATVAAVLGRWLLQQLHRPEGNAFGRLAWGALALAFATSLPWVGGPVALLAIAGGLGALVCDRGRPLLHRQTESAK